MPGWYVFTSHVLLMICNHFATIGSGMDIANIGYKMRNLFVTTLLGVGLMLSLSVRAGDVFINEVLANNATYAESTGSTPDWVEFYNASTNDVNLEGMSLSSDPLNPRKWIFPNGSIIRGGRYLVVYFDSTTAASAYNTGYGLNADGDAVYLFNASSQLVDSVVFGIQIPDYSIGRQQSVAAAFALMEPTKGSANVLVSMGNPSALKINEWMADPDGDDDWFEIFNTDARPVALGGLYLTNSLKKTPRKFRIPSLSFIGTGAQAFQKFIADDKVANGPKHVNFKLSKDGDELGIFPEIGAAIDSVIFLGQLNGVSEGRLPDGNASTVVKFYTTPSPAESNYLPLSTVVINEVLTHTDTPLEDAIELLNPTANVVDIGGWFLSDSLSNLKKFRIPTGTQLSGLGYLVYYEHDFTNGLVAFNLNSSEGDSVYVSAADAVGNLTGYRATISFGPTFNATTLGRYTNSVGMVQYPLQITNTIGSPNSGPAVGSVVISEIMFQPPPAVGTTNDNVQDEYVELYNITGAPVPLHHVVETTNTWRLRGGVDYDFPQNAVIPAGGYVLVVSFDPETNTVARAEFVSRYGVPEGVKLFGPYDGKLSNSSEPISLQEPDYIQGKTHINEGFVPYVTVEQVDYSSLYPWPTGAAGTGYSLQKTNAFLYGNDPVLWKAGGPTPGWHNVGAATDLDGDGMPDEWELACGLNPFSSLDATLDKDADGMSNRDEYVCGTNPGDAASKLTIGSVVPKGKSMAIVISVMAGRSYSVWYCDNALNSKWQVLTNISAVSASQTIEVTDTTPTAAARYYRLSTP